MSVHVLWNSVPFALCLAEYLEAAGIDPEFRIHDMRHTCASILINAGATLKGVQDVLGHSSITVTMDRYGHLYTETRLRTRDMQEEFIAAQLGGRNAEKPVPVDPAPDGPNRETQAYQGV